MSDALPQKSFTTPVPANETERLATLHRYKILDTPPEAAFDRITKLAARLFNMPIALISLVDESRAWFKSSIGFGADEVPRDATLCSFAVLTDEPLIIPDARLDDRFACNPFVQSKPGVRFYAGAPLLSHDGFNLGTLCLLDNQPRDPLTLEQQATLVDLAAMVVDELELRLAADRIAQVDAALLEITQGVASVTGGAFFDALVQHYANVDTDYVYIGIVEGDDPRIMKMIATYAHGQIVDNLEYSLQDTPCWEVIQQRKICCYPRNVQAQFPNAPLLKPLSVESYVAAPLFDSNGTPIGLLGVMDGEPLEHVHLAESLLTIFANRIATELERQQTEVTLRESEEKYRTLFESINEGFCICEMLFDENGRPDNYRFLEVNPVFAKFTGLEGATGKTARELVPNLADHWVEIYGRLVQTGEPGRFEQQLIATNRWFDVNAFCIGEPQCHQFALLFSEISDRKKFDQERERFFAVASDLQVITRADGYFQWVSPTFERLLGWTVEEMTSRPWTDFVYPDDINPSVSEIDSLFSGSKTFAFENRYRHKDGSYRWLLWKAQPYLEEQVIYGAAVDITVRKQSEAALRESEELKQRILESSQDCIKVLTLNSEISYISPGGLRLLEIADPNSILNTVWANSWQGEDYEKAKAAIAAATRGNTGQFQGYLPTAKGIPKWWDSIITPVLDAVGQVVQLVVISRDITEARRNGADRQKAELALQEAHVQLESALAAGAIYTWRWNIPADRVVVNAAFARLFGVDSAATTEGLPIEFFINSMHEEDRPHVLAAIQQAIATGEVYTTEYRIHTATNKERWVTARGQVEYDAAGLPIAFPSALADITERKRAEEDRDRFFQLSRDMLAIINTDGYFLQANPAWTEILGYTAQELTAQPYIEFVHPDDREATINEALMLAQGIPSFAFENRYRCRDGSYCWISWSVAPFVEQELLYCVARNVTDRKQAEAERERLLIREQSAREEAEAANRLKDEFLAVLSHELRSPLNPILGWSRLLQNGKLDPTRQIEALKTIERNAKLQSQLIEDLLDISRIMQGKLSFTAAPVNLMFVISAAIETVRLAAEAKNIRILLDLDTAIAPVSGDTARLQQVVWNLLTNAVKFTPQGGKVTVELRQLERLAQIRLIDTGIGINQQFLPHVFEYFRQEDGSTTRKFGGLGLGLAIVRQIVELHGGTVEADSLGEGQGATFTVRLPLSRRGEGQENSEQRLFDRSLTDQPLSGLRVLVADDEPDMRDLISFSLEQAGAEVMTVAAAWDALAALPQFQPNILLSDIGLPDMDGYMLLRQIRALPLDQGGQVPAIALTAYAGDFNQQQVLQAGFQQHLAKPVEPERLIETIISLLGSHP